MNRFLHGVARAAFETFALPGPVLEVGSYQVAGQEAISDLRGYFPDTPYVGLDLREGPGVDVVGSVEELPYESGSFGTVIALSTFEHVERFWRGFDEVRRVLRPDGVFLVSCPFYFHIHSYPSDYWRFTPEAFKLLLAPYPNKIIGWHGPVDQPGNVWGLAFREEHPPVTAAQLAHYRDALRRHAREPLPFRRKLRYRLGQILFGRGPFAPWMLRERWQIEALSEPAVGSPSRTGKEAVVACPSAAPDSVFRPAPSPAAPRAPRSRSASSTGTAEPSCAVASPR
jgi:SAM-dependent methyltransferase